MSMIETKKNKIKDSLNKTKKKRKSQIAVIIKTKLDNDKLNNNTVTTLNRIFLEAKWLYNYILNDEFNDDIFKSDYNRMSKHTSTYDIHYFRPWNSCNFIGHYNAVVRNY